MRRLLRIALNAIGLLIAAIFFIIFLWALEGRQYIIQSSPQSPQPYPIATQAIPITPLSGVFPKPIPVTPPATIPSKLSSQSKNMTLTPIPYPPPETPPPLITPTQFTQPTMIALPPLPTPIPTTSGILPAGMKIIYGETDGPAGNTTIWIANTTLELKKKLITLVHKSGYGVTGAVSPDSKQIAYLLISPQSSEREARIKGGTLWVMNLDGTNPHPVADEVASQFMWSPDGLKIAYYHLVELEKPKDPQVPLKTELYSVSTDGKNQELLLSNDIDYGIYLLGWSLDGKSFYYAASTLQRQWEVWKIDIESGSTQLESKLPYAIVQSLQLSPDSKNLLFSAFDNNGQYILAINSIDGKLQEIIASGAAGDEPINQYSAVWSPDSKELLARFPPYSGHPGGLEQIELASDQTKPILNEAAGTSEFFIPQSWSPDGRWSTILQYPHIQSFVYLLKLSDGSIMQLPLTQSSNWITPFGWTILDK